jgi:hypothetical protein
MMVKWLKAIENGFQPFAQTLSEFVGSFGWLLT